MNIATSIEQYNCNYVFLCDSVKNNVMADGSFTRVLYSTDTMVLNGIYLIVPIHDCNCEKYYNKFRCNFSVKFHQAMLDHLKSIETTILQMANIQNKHMQLKITDQLANGNIKVFDDISSFTNCAFILKISGIWETSNNYGLTYKFILAK